MTKVMQIGHKLPTRYTMKDGSNVIELEITEKERPWSLHYKRCKVPGRSDRNVQNSDWERTCQ